MHFSKPVRIAIGLSLGIGFIIVVNDRRQVSQQIHVPSAELVFVETDGVVDRFRQAIRHETISYTNPARSDDEVFAQFVRFCKDAFPSLHQPPIVRRTGGDFGDPANHSLLFQWTGSDPTLEPILLMAHYDVVPIAEADTHRAPVAGESDTSGTWIHPPFSGALDQGFLWGRGTLDAKNASLGMLEAMRLLVEAGYLPERTIYLALGHDEEVGGTRGNREIAHWMKSQGLRLQFVLDEGGCIYTGFPGLDSSVALIGITEKGYANVRLTASVPTGGHASMPPEQTAIEVLATAIDRLRRNPLPRRMTDASETMLDFLGPEMPLPGRLAIANRWLLKPLILRRLGATESGNAMLRTTLAPTLIRGGVRENVLPREAHVTINVRLLPEDRMENVIGHMESTIGDPRVALEIIGPAREAAFTSSTTDPAFIALHRSVKEIYPDVVVAPFVLVGGTDSYHYQEIARNIYRFIPARLTAQDLTRIHGVNERIALEDYLDLIQFYVRVIKNLTSDLAH